jgi:2-polyprenyl-3-methyl-5-hydroxy-6-metoxy-1,4-benzoquinol methylase
LQSRDFETATGNYAICYCQQCKVRFTNPQPLPQEIGKLYQTRTTADFPNPHPFMEKLRNYKITHSINKFFQQFNLKNVSVLDFGCGDGFFSSRVAYTEQCRHLTAVDFHEAPPFYLSGSTGKVTYQTVDTFYQDKDHHYDVIFCRHVLEHVHNPVEFLAQLKQKLNTPGYLMIEVPNFDSMWRVIFGQYFSGLYVPRHLFHFDANTLRNTLEKVDFKVDSVKLAHLPLLSASLCYLTGLPLKNLGMSSIVLFPLQIAVDELFRSSTILIAIATKNE